MNQLYEYVGPAEIAKRAFNSDRIAIKSPNDVLKWFWRTTRSKSSSASITVTFVISGDGELWVADRRSEHVACARGAKVLSAGEMTFTISKGDAFVSEVTNQSTGYCPHTDSWSAVAAALDAAGIDHPDDFTAKYVFRKCSCGQVNIVKDNLFMCAVCGLPFD